MTSFPVPARAPWFSSRAMFAFVPGLSEPYQERISRTRAVARWPPCGVAEAFGATAVSGFIERSIVRAVLRHQAPTAARSRPSGLGNRRVSCGAQEPGQLVPDDPHRDRGEKRPQVVLVAERLQKHVPLQRRQDLGRDAATEIDAGPRDRPQGQVARLRAVDADEEPERLLARGALPRHPTAADDLGRSVDIRLLHVPGPLRRRPALPMKELSERHEAWPGKNALPAHPAVAVPEHPQDPN